MKPSSTILPAALLCAAIAVPATISSAQQKSLKDQLIGTWTLASWERMSANGNKLQSYGANPKGEVVFGRSGRMFVMFARSDLPKLASKNPATATPDEAKAILAGSIAYFGTWAVNDADKVITFHIESSTFPNQVGANQKRTISSITANELKYDTNALNGDKISIGLKRAPSTVGRQ